MRRPGPAGVAAVDWPAYRREFPIFERTTYFNTCSLGALSTRVVAAIADLEREGIR